KGLDPAESFAPNLARDLASRPIGIPRGIGHRLLELLDGRGPLAEEIDDLQTRPLQVEVRVDEAGDDGPGRVHMFCTWWCRRTDVFVPADGVDASCRIHEHRLRARQ